MKKKIFALLLMMLIALTPQALADTFVNQAFVGTYLSAGATNDNYGMLNITKCDENAIAVDFRFIKNGNEQLIYTMSEGVMDEDTGKLRFSVSYSDGRFVSNGTMTVTLTDWCVKVSCDSDQGQHLFDGTMKPQFNLNPYTDPENIGSTDIPVTHSISMNPGVSVVLNGQTMTFPEGINPIIINDYTFVPLRSVFDKMGINVYWDQYKKNEILNAQSITCTKNDTIVQFMRTFNETGENVWTLTKWVGENTDSAKYTRINITDLQPTIIGNTSYIPLRVVSEAFGADVGWLGEEKIVDIICDTANEYKYDNELIGKIEDYSQDIADTYITEDYTDVTADTTPYFSPQAKFYKYSATDRWGKVTLNVIYGGYIDVFPVTDEATEAPAEETVEVPTDEPEEVPTDAPTEEAKLPTEEPELPAEETTPAPSEAE